MNKEIAASLAAELGITVSINERYSNQPAGAFISQSIKPGSIYESGQVLELNYSIDNRIPLPSFVDKTRDAIEAWAQEHNKMAPPSPSRQPIPEAIHRRNHSVPKQSQYLDRRQHHHKYNGIQRQGGICRILWPPPAPVMTPP